LQQFISNRFYHHLFMIKRLLDLQVDVVWKVMERVS